MLEKVRKWAEPCFTCKLWFYILELSF